MQLHDKAARRIAADLLRAVAKAVPFKIHTVLTDNGVQFTDNLPDRTAPETEAAIDAIWTARGEPRMYRIPAFDGACIQLGIEHRLSKPCHPWTTDKIEPLFRIPACYSPLAHG